MKNITENYVQELNKNIVEEARMVRGCYRNFAFSALVFTSLMLGLIVRFQVDDPKLNYAGFAGIPVIILLLSITRIGIFKFSTITRLLGYKLYTERTRYYTYSSFESLEV